MLTVWPVLLFRGRFPIHYLGNHQGGLDWSIVLDVPSNATVHARYAAGFRNTLVFSGWMRRIFNGRIKSRLVSRIYLINQVSIIFAYVLPLSFLLLHYL